MDRIDLNLRLKMTFDDRVGIVADVASVIGAHLWSIGALEVEQLEGKALLYLEINFRGNSSNQDALVHDLAALNGLMGLERIAVLPREKRERNLEVVINSVSDGILAADDKSRLLIANPLARKAYGLTTADLGRSLDELGLGDGVLAEALSRPVDKNNCRHVQQTRGGYGFVSFAHSITGKSGNILGAVLVLREVQEVKALARTIRESDQIRFEDVIGNSPALATALAFARQVATLESVVSIRGESGTGKEMFARAIHAHSKRPGPFVPVNCAAIPEHLLESELFGYEAGSFTGANRQGKKGLFEKAGQGTVLLDEIADLPKGAQAKLLRVLQEHRVRPIGGSTEKIFKARIICATSRDLESMVEKGEFREDLYYRINVLPVYIPPLRDRREDISLLAVFFLESLAQIMDSVPDEISRKAVAVLNDYNWPGNIRELRNVIERAAVLCPSSRLNAETVSRSLMTGNSVSSPVSEQRAQSLSLKQEMAGYEKEIVDRAMRANRSIRAAARELGISHTALRSKIAKHGFFGNK